MWILFKILTQSLFFSLYTLDLDSRFELFFFPIANFQVTCSIYSLEKFRLSRNGIYIFRKYFARYRVITRVIPPRGEAMTFRTLFSLAQAIVLSDRFVLYRLFRKTRNVFCLIFFCHLSRRK